MSNNYYRISLAFEVQKDVLESQDPDITRAVEILVENLPKSIPSGYEIFSENLVQYYLNDTSNFVVSYDAFIRSFGDLPMAEYVAARNVKDKIKEELEEFFSSIDCEYRQINIKSLL